MPQPGTNRLDAIPTRLSKCQVFRLASIANHVEALNKLGLDAQSSQEMRELLQITGYWQSPDELFLIPFRQKRRRPWATRFSDGSFPVLYCSLEPDTAKAEVQYWFSKFSGRPSRRRSAYYRQISCSFEGTTKDLRPKLAAWPDLIHPDDYTFCNRLGAEAIRLGLDGVLTPSARRSNGANLPIFRSQAIAMANEDDLITITADPVEAAE